MAGKDPLLEMCRVSPDKVNDIISTASPDGNGVNVEAIPADVLFGFIAKNAGREVGSWDDLKLTEREVVREVPLSYASEEAADIDRYARETGRGVRDYLELQKNWSAESDDVVAERFRRQEHPEFSDDDIRELMRLDFGQEEVNEDEMEEHEASRIKDSNRRKELAKKSYASKGRLFFEQQQQKYKTPEEQRADSLGKGEVAWREAMTRTMDGMEELKFGDFAYKLGDKGKYGHLSDFGKLLDSFKGADGAMDYGRFARTVIAGTETEQLLTSHQKWVEERTRTELMRESSNKDGLLQRSINNHEYTDYEKLKEENKKKMRGY